MRTSEFSTPGDAVILGESWNNYRFFPYAYPYVSPSAKDSLCSFNHESHMNLLYADAHAGAVSIAEYNKKVADTKDPLFHGQTH